MNFDKRFKKLPLVIQKSIVVIIFLGVCFSWIYILPTTSLNNIQTSQEDESTITLVEATKITPTNLYELTIDGTPTTPTKIFFTVTPRPTRTPRPTSTPKPQIVVNTKTNVYSGPNINYPIVDEVIYGQLLLIIATNKDKTWYNVRLGSGRLAWIESSMITPVDQNSFLAVKVALTIPAIPTPVILLPTKTTSPLVQIAPTPIETIETPPTIGVFANCTCTIGEDLDCSDFSTRYEAQVCYNHCMELRGADIYGIDGNNSNGLACESLP